MSTERQIAANRLNAQKSTGPRTDEGRAAVRLNAVKHGLCARTLVLPGEDEAEFQALFDDLQETHKPANRTEAMLVRQMAIAAWCLDRAYHVEGAFLHSELKDNAGIRDKYHPNLDHHGKLAYLHRDYTNRSALDHFARHQVRLERAFRQALRELDRVQAKRTATVRERPLREQQPLREERPQEIGSVLQKPKQPIPINQINNLAPPSETCIQSNPCHEPSPPTEPAA